MYDVRVFVMQFAIIEGYSKSDCSNELLLLYIKRNNTHLVLSKHIIYEFY